MAQSRLFIYIKNREQDNISWLISGEKTASQDLQKLTEIAAKYEVIVILPAEDFSIFKLDIKTRSKKTLLQALPFALEDNLLNDIEELCFVPGDKADDGSFDVWVTTHENMTSWQANMSELGVRVAALVPETAIIAKSANIDSAELWLLEHKAILQDGAEFSTILPANFTEVLANIEFDDKQRSIIKFTDSLDFNYPDFDTVNDEQSVLAYYAASLERHIPINIAQGQYYSSKTGTNKMKHWHMVAYLLLIFIGIKMFMLAYDNATLQNQVTAIGEKIEKIYMATFPKSDKVVNAKAQMEAKLRQLKPSGPMLMPILTTASQLINDDANVKLEEIIIGKSNIQLVLQAGDVASMEKIASAFKHSELLSVSGSGKNFNGTIKMVKKQQ